jgi:hypothetical protein
MEPIKKLRGDHCLNVFVSYELKSQLVELAEKYDRSLADMMRAVLRVGILVMEGVGEAEEVLVKEYVDVFRRLRRAKKRKR